MHVYVLIDPLDQQIKYVGSTVGRLSGKLATHLHDSKRQKHPVAKWIQSLLAAEAKPIIESLEYHCNESELRKSEEFFIRYLHYIGIPILNTTYIRKSDRPKTLSEEHRCKLSKAKEGKNNLQKRKRVGQYTLDGHFVKEWLGVIEAQKQMNCKAISVTIKKHGRAGGYLWRYLA